MDPDKKINITVRVGLERMSDAALIAQVGFRNDGEQPVLLWKRLTVPEGKLDGEYFVVTADGQPVEYLGRTAKRSPPGPEEFMLLAPRQVVVSKVTLSQYYAIPEHGRITVVYEAFNPSIHDQPLTGFSSNAASIDLP